jgi:hypothetical protein
MSAEPASRRKSCGECVKGKRKCGMQRPQCQRCQKKNIDCSYPSHNNPSINDINIPELDFPWLDDLMRDPGVMPWAGGLQPQLAASSLSSTETIEVQPQPVPEYLLGVGNEQPTRSTLARSEVEAAVHRFKSWPEKWLKEGKAPFIHPRLYVSSMPGPLQDAYAACAIYSTKTPENDFIAFSVIEAKANELLRSPNQASWTPLDLLAAVQALLIFQFIRLFDGDIRQRALAENAGPMLESWTIQLRARTEQEQTFDTTTAPSWRSWIFGESVRRTITMSFMLLGVYAMVKQGFCTLADQVSANSFTANKVLWDAASALEWDRTRQTSNPLWVPKMKFDSLLQEASGPELDDFAMIMLITCKGQDVTDNWLASMHRVEKFIRAPNLSQSFFDAINDGSYVMPSETV